MRDLTIGLSAEVVAPKLRPVLFFEGEFLAPGGPPFTYEYLRLWTGLGPITWNAQTWTGAGSLIGVSEIGETTDVQAVGVTVTLSGMPSTLLIKALLSSRQGRPGRIWLGAMTEAGAVIADPYLAFEGRLDVPSVEDVGEAGTISITYESRLIDLLRARERRYTHEDQQIDYPGDKGFEFVPSMQDINIKLGNG